MPKVNLQASNKQLTTPAGKLKYLGYVCTNFKYKNLSIEDKMYILCPGSSSSNLLIRKANVTMGIV